MGRYFFFILSMCASPLMAQNVNSDFQSFRKGMIESYNGFRQSVLDDYVKYLQGVWKEYEEFRGEKRDNTPKPVIMPKIGEQTEEPQSPPNLPEVSPKDDQSATPIVQNPVSVTPTIPSSPTANTLIDVPFYCMTIKVASCKPHCVAHIDNGEIATVWKAYKNDAAMQDVIRSLKTVIDKYGLNDWFAFVLVKDYSEKLTDSIYGRIVLQHYLLTNMGYDIRLASTEKQLLLLVSFKQQVYERSYVVLDGRKYYAFYDSSSSMENVCRNRIYTCELPRNSNAGEALDLTIRGGRLGIKSNMGHLFQVSDGKIGLKGAVDKGMMEALRHYPQTDIPCYAMSMVDSELHTSLLEQMKTQTQGLSEKDAVNRILHFVQYAFGYATDEEQHGYEKPYFIEENFYYPKNDCEDRAVLFAFFVHNILGLDVHLIHYPGHECAAVSFSSPITNGDGYVFKGKTYYICDPTYIGAMAGQCMPSFKSVKPVIEQWY